MPKSKAHFFKANINIKGRSKCLKCKCEKVDKRNGEFDIIRGGFIDTTASRLICFKLSKD